MVSPMASLKARKPVKTYTRQRKHSRSNEGPPMKRRRVDTLDRTLETNCPLPIDNISSSPSHDLSIYPPSSPKGPRIFSNASLQSTPSSSPQRSKPSPPVQRRRPIFSFFKRQSDPAPGPLNPLSDHPPNIPAPGLNPKKKLVQAQLDLVPDIRKTCKTCGMQYIPSNPSDIQLHKKFHAMNVGGIDLPKSFVEKVLRRKQVNGGADGSFIAVISRRDSTALRSRAVDVLNVVNTELAAVPIPDGLLWSQAHVPSADLWAPRESGDEREMKITATDRYKLYMYILRHKCVGACLAERIHEAHTVLDREQVSPAPDLLSRDSPSCISISSNKDPVMLGISRIWTSNLHRKHGIATRLLDAASKDFVYGMTVEKDMMAFSQPTESGGRLARKWFGRRNGWHVYVD
ncbi:hypothetical protein CC78DRAFT_502296 [Lojkania enalia]|uniref:Sister chromatid cohesion acetyltransferase Eco1 n=1 Tax=Lojkania enalia TaxID=147567 RepID=A0A9P4MW96_9PLEO|nr:hypothetical protein CC78DRAFT_502296 [Didymosphaeria enalia]